MQRAFFGALVGLVGLVGLACTTGTPAPSAGNAPAPAAPAVVQRAPLTPAPDPTARVVVASRLPAARPAQRVVTAQPAPSVAPTISGPPTPSPTPTGSVPSEPEPVATAALLTSFENALPPVATAPAQRPAIAASETPAPIVTEVPTPQPTPDLVAIGSSADSFDPNGLSAAGNAGFEVLDDPVMIAARDATWLRADDVILGVVHPSGEAHAFPVRQMAYHHIANIVIAGDPYLVTY